MEKSPSLRGKINYKSYVKLPEGRAPALKTFGTLGSCGASTDVACTCTKPCLRWQRTVKKKLGNQKNMIIY
jgi:hypothetical protein